MRGLFWKLFWLRSRNQNGSWRHLFQQSRIFTSRWDSLRLKPVVMTVTNAKAILCWGLSSTGQSHLMINYYPPAQIFPVQKFEVNNIVTNWLSHREKGIFLFSNKLVKCTSLILYSGRNHVSSLRFLAFLCSGSSPSSKNSFKALTALPLCDISFLISDGISAYLKKKNQMRTSTCSLTKCVLRSV